MGQIKKVDNFKTSAKLTILFGVLAIVAIIALIFAIFSPYVHKIYYWTIFTITFAIYAILWIINPHYVGLYENKNSISIRFYFVHPFLFNYKQIKIKKNELYDYKIKKRLGLFKQLILYSKKGKQIWKYPPIELSALSKKELTELLKILDTLKIKKTKSHK